MSWLAVAVLLFAVTYGACLDQYDDETDWNKGLLFDAFPTSILSFPINANDVKQQSSKVTKKIDCVFLCIESPWCRSVNFQTTPQINGLHACELLSTDSYSHPENMKHNNTFTHFSIKNPCKKGPCVNKGICTNVLSNRQDYHCECGKAFDGKNCQHGNAEYCEFEVDMCRWTSDPQNTFKWYRERGATPSLDTGPTGDITQPLNGTGYYVYAEASSPATANQAAELKSPIFAATSGRCFQFAYHMYGSTMGTMNVYVVDAQTGTNTTIFTKHGGQGQQWHRANATITSSNTYQIVFEVIRGNGYYSDVALDDLFFKNGNC